MIKVIICVAIGVVLGAVAVMVYACFCLESKLDDQERKEWENYE